MRLGNFCAEVMRAPLPSPSSHHFTTCPSNLTCFISSPVRMLRFDSKGPASHPNVRAAASGVRSASLIHFLAASRPASSLRHRPP
jgi:hypothetical protein